MIQDRVSSPSEATAAGPGGDDLRSAEVMIAVLAAALAGVNPLLHGLYARTSWAWLGFAAFGVLLVAVVAVRRGPGRLPVAACVALAALAGWQFASRSWAESSDQALIEAQRTAVYAACLAVLVTVLAHRRAQLAFVVVLAVATTAVGAIEWTRLVAGAVPPDFVGGRLSDPLGYMNGEAAALLLGFWPCVAIAERGRHPAAGAVAVWAATLLLALAFLTQSRAALGALVVSLAVVLIALPGRGRRLPAILLPCVGVAVAAPRMLDVYDSGNRRAALPEASVLHPAMALAMVAAVIVALVWLALDRAAARAPVSDLRRLLRPAAIAGIVVALVVVAVGAVPAAREVSDQWAAFRSLQQPTGANRLTTAGGNRYDYWRVALEQFRSEPVRGIGAGNYDTTYFRDRRTTEDVRQPHSLVLQTLAELGLVGVALLVALLGVTLYAFARARRRASRLADERALLVAAAGTLVMFIVHTDVDWLHLLPGITLAALGMIALVLRLGDASGPPRSLVTRSPAPQRAVAFSLTLLALASIATSYRADRDGEAAKAALSSDPASAVRDASNALRLEGKSLPTLYILAAAYARQGSYERALGTLLRARALEPSDFIPPVLIGDLARRRGDRQLALTAYRTARRLNPRDPTIVQAIDELRNSSSP